MVTTTASTIPAVVSSVKWLEDELELNALDNPGSRCGSGNEKAAAGQRTALSAALGGRVEVAAMSTISDLNIVIQEAVDILKVVEGANKLKGAEGPSGVLRGAQNAWDMLSDEQSQKHITTGSGDLDGILGGGIHCKEVTEIDTEGSFMVERVYQIAEGCISDMIEYFPYRHDKASSGQENLQPERFLADIYYFQICTYTEQIAVINYLENFLGEHKDVRIVIIDSVTFHFRQDFDDLALRTRVLSGLSLKLMKLSIWINGLYFDAGTIVVLLNQVTTKFTEGSFQLTLALDLNRISLAAIELSRSDSPRGLQMTKGCRQGLLFSGADRIHVLLYSS